MNDCVCNTHVCSQSARSGATSAQSRPFVLHNCADAYGKVTKYVHNTALNATEEICICHINPYIVDKYEYNSVV